MADAPLDLADEPVANLHAIVHQGPVLRARGPVARVLRSAALRFMRPFIAYQQQVNVATVEATEALQQRMTAYQVETALLLAELRRVERANARAGGSVDSPARRDD